jgi:hypothetical protein
MLALVGFTAAAAPGSVTPLEATGLRSIAAWLQAKGQPGYVADEVADAMGIPRAGAQGMVDAMQRGFRDDEVLRMAQAIAPDTLLFMVQAQGEVYFYLSTVRGGLRKALLSVPSRESVMPLDASEAETNFRREVQYWEDKTSH